jgi:hypothetical protein
MAQVLLKGTAWDRSLEDYAHAVGLDRLGWAWEFLRRNEAYCRDYRINRAGVPVAIRHESGAIIFRPRRQFLAAENWGLEIFADPAKSAFDTHVFWMGDTIKRTVSCISKTANDNQSERLSLSHFSGKRSVLVAKSSEQIVFVGPQMSVQLLASGKSFLIGESLLTFQHEGLRTASSHQDAVKILRQFE